MSDELPVLKPSEDSGAVTEDRYRFQHHCVARHLLTALIERRELTIVCEYKEDFLVIGDGLGEAVSVKHRELSQGAWTLSTIADAGGLRKLFETWSEADGKPTCRLMTNAGLGPGADGAHWIASFTSDENEHRAHIIKALGERFGAAAAPVATFLREALRVDAGLPARHMMETQQRIHLLGPAYGTLDESAEGSAAEYRALLELIYNHSADEDPLKSDVRLALVTAGEAQAERLADAKVKARALTTADARECLLKARREPYPVLPAAQDGPAPTRMRRKLEAGRLLETEVQLATRLRSHWYAAEARERDTPNFADELAGLEVEVQALAGAAQRKAAEQLGTTPYGGRMLELLRDHLKADDAPAPRREFDNARLLEGLAYELTDRCQVWWSPESEVDLSGLAPPPGADVADEGSTTGDHEDA